MDISFRLIFGHCYSLGNAIICLSMLICTLYWGGYLNFSAWFMKSILFGHEKIKLSNTWHFLENKMDYAAHLKNAVYFPVA